MGDLEARLREIVGPVRLPGLASPGKLAYEGFWGVGSTPVVADGMVFDWSGNTLFVTTRALYMRAVGALRVRSDEDDMVSRTVLGGHVAFVTFANLPVRKGGSTKRVRAVVGVAFQAYGPWPPNYLVVQVERGERVSVVGASLEPPLEQVDDCEARFNADMSKIPHGANEDRLQDRVYDTYRRCIGSALPSRPSFAAVLGRAQAIVDQLEAGDAEGPPTGVR